MSKLTTDMKPEDPGDPDVKLVVPDAVRPKQIQIQNSKSSQVLAINQAFQNRKQSDDVNLTLEGPLDTEICQAMIDKGYAVSQSYHYDSTDPESGKYCVSFSTPGSGAGQSGLLPMRQIFRPFDSFWLSDPFFTRSRDRFF
jgi:hypothetical protein